jgi:hypothetical protein
MRLSKIAITAVLGNCKDERTFSNLDFVKNRVWNHLGGHLVTIVKLYLQGYYSIESFSFVEAYCD